MDYRLATDVREAALPILSLAVAALVVIAHWSRFLPRAIQWLRRDPLVRGLLVALCLSIGPITARTKNGLLFLPHSSAPLYSEPLAEPSPFVFCEARTNGVAMVAPTTNAVVSQFCLRCGTSECGEWVELDAPFFRWGTNDIRRLYASPGCLSFGSMRHPYHGDTLPNGTDAESLAVLRTPLGIVPAANWHLSKGTGIISRFWHDSLPHGGRVFTWENALLDRHPDRPATIQAELRTNGDFVYRYDFSTASPTGTVLIGAQKAEIGVEALSIGAETNSTTIWRIDGATNTNGVSAADLFATAPIVEFRWRNASELGDLSLDPDDDGISSHDEIFLYGTEPLFADSDADGVADNIELMTRTDPFDADEDIDGIPDGISAAVWTANALHADVAGFTNTVLRVLQPAAPGTSAFVSIGSLTIPLSTARDIPLALPVDQTVPIGVVSFGDSGARIALSGPDVTMSVRGGGPHTARRRTGSSSMEPMGGLLFDPHGLFSGQPLFETRDEVVYILLTRLDLAQLDGHASECVHEVPGIRRFCPVLPTGVWPAIRDSATIAGFQEEGDALTLTVADEPRSIATGTVSFSPPSLVWGEVSASASIHRCEAIGVTLSGCDLCWDWYGIDHDTRDFPVHLQNHALAVQHDSAPWPELSLTDASVPAVWSVSPSGGVQLHVMGSDGQTTPYMSGAEVSSVLVEPGSSPGVYTVSVRHPLDNEDVDSAEVIVFRVDRIEVFSDKLGESPNPPPFAGEREWGFSPTNSPSPDKHAAVFFRDVASPTNDFAVQTFDVTFCAVLFPLVPPSLLPPTHWTRIEGPDSGSLVVNNPLEAVLRNPAQGGVYRLSFEACADGPHPSEATLSLSWEAGCNVATGAMYSATVSNLVHTIWNPDDPKVGRTWPNLAPLDNLIPPNLAWDMNDYFCTPFFLYAPPQNNP